MSELVLELFSEEIPAFMQKKAEVAYHEIFSKHLTSNEITFENIKVFSGPRRVTILVKGLPKFIEAKEVEIKGPKVGAPDQAIEGFCKSNGISIKELAQKEINGQFFYVYLKSLPQTALKVLLLEILPVAIKEYTWPKSMYWGDYDISWVRPLKSIMCLFDGEVLAIKFGHLTADNITYGHRFMAPEKLEIKNFEDYKTKLFQAYVIIDREERQEIIKGKLDEIAREWELIDDKKLLEEVTGLVELPNVMIGQIPEKFLQLPEEVLIASTRTHQKYFCCRNREGPNGGKIAPYFFFVSNISSLNQSDENFNEIERTIIAGNEKVLSARLSDALYFYEQDLAKGLEVMGEKLKTIVFHEKLGSLADKVERVKKICKFLASDNHNLQIAASLCKNDLVSEMVGEFPELQGIMGYYYAVNKEFDTNSVARAIKNHYRPQGLSDSTPPRGNASLLAIADKMDSFVGLMLAGEVPTGSGDPYALRRIALGIIRIILECELAVNLKELIDYCISLFSFANNNKDHQFQLLQFIEERAKFYFKNDYDISLINAVLDLNKEGDLLIIKLKLDALKDFLKASMGHELLTSYKRANNILAGKKLEGHVNADDFELKEEQELFSELNNVAGIIDQGIRENDFPKTLESLVTLNSSIKNFFDNIMVNDPDTKLANNRLLLLQEVKQLFEKIAKFDQL